MNYRVYLHENDHTTAFNSSASWIELNALDGSTGRTYEAASHPKYYLTAYAHTLLIRQESFHIDLQAQYSWDLRVVDDSNAVWTRPGKKQEIDNFSGGAIIYSRKNRNEALGFAAHSNTMAILTSSHLGKYFTRFNIVPSLLGDKNAISFQSKFENYYLAVFYDTKFIIQLKRYEDSDVYKQMASFFPVHALDDSQGFSFRSAYIMDSYVCGVQTNQKIEVKFTILTERTRSCRRRNWWPPWIRFVASLQRGSERQHSSMDPRFAV